MATLTDEFGELLGKLSQDLEKFNNTCTNLAKARYCKRVLLKDMENLRSVADQMELLIGKDFSTFPTYDDILYSVKY